MTLKIITGGLQTTIQDLGRIGHQGQGVPVGGAMDRVALRLANLLVGNDENAAALEATLIGPAITFERESLIALAGGDLEASIDGIQAATWHPILVGANATLRFGRARVGCRAYVAVAGGIDVAPVFGSRSTYLRAKFGGFEGRALKSGDAVHSCSPSGIGRRIGNELRASGGGRFVVGRWSVATSIRPKYVDDVVVRVVGGAHLDALSEGARATFLNATFRVSSNSDRMGYRLEGAELTPRVPIELLSEGTTCGTVQLPPGGAPIVLMADAQTTGGYPRIAEVAAVDLPLVAQLKPGERLRFRLISLDEAQAHYLDREQEIAEARTAIGLRYGRDSR